MAEKMKQHILQESKVQSLSSKDQLVRAQVLVAGRVQGVAFRAFTQREARRLNVKGWVRNLANGCVEAEVEGRQSSVDLLLVSLKQGPSLAHVEQVSVNWVNVQGEIDDFRIIR